MSRLAKAPILLPKGVEVKASPKGVVVKGAKGTTELTFPAGISFKIEPHGLFITYNENEVTSKALIGLHRALLKNAVVGVSEGFEIKLVLIGVGYRANVAGTKLDLQVGFSHPTALEIPKGLQIVVDKGTAISIKGIDKHLVGQFAAEVRAMKPPEPYKGKGIRYENEYVRKKEGKAAKGKA